MDCGTAEKVIAATGADIRHGGGRAAYFPGADYIQVPEKQAFEKAHEYYCTVGHELVHWTGHERRLNRLDKLARFGNEAYAVEELVAELASAFLLADIGMPQSDDLTNVTAYLASWLRVLGRDHSAIFTASSAASKAVDFILSFSRPAGAEADAGASWPMSPVRGSPHALKPSPHTPSADRRGLLFAPAAAGELYNRQRGDPQATRVQGMKWFVDEAGTPGESTLVITVTKEEQRRLAAYMRRSEAGELGSHEPTFGSDDFLYDLLESMFSDDSFTWLPEGTTGDMTSAPMIGILGDEMPGPAPGRAQCSGLYPCGRWEVGGHLREMYQPVLQRWAFMDYAVTSPQRELAEHGRCEWQGGDYWGSQEAAERAAAEHAAGHRASAR